MSVIEVVRKAAWNVVRTFFSLYDTRTVAHTHVCRVNSVEVLTWWTSTKHRATSSNQFGTTFSVCEKMRLLCMKNSEFKDFPDLGRSWNLFFRVPGKKLTLKNRGSTPEKLNLVFEFTVLFRCPTLRPLSLVFGCSLTNQTFKQHNRS